MIRHAATTDAQRLAEITVAGWQTAYIGIVPDDVIQRQTVDSHITYWLTDEAHRPPMHTWVSEAEDQVVGYAHVGPFRSETGETNSLGELWGLYVDPGYHRGGHGGALMAVVLDHFRACGYESAYLWVMRDNAPARSLYESTGWQLDDSINRVKPFQEVRYICHP